MAEVLPAPIRKGASDSCHAQTYKVVKFIAGLPGCWFSLGLYSARLETFKISTRIQQIYCTALSEF